VRRTKIFGGSSHPEITSLITTRLGVEPGAVKLSQFKNKETSVEIGTSDYEFNKDTEVFVARIHEWRRSLHGKSLLVFHVLTSPIDTV
jgi:phosphoribosylpyrophosphate synthetase